MSDIGSLLSGQSSYQDWWDQNLNPANQTATDYSEGPAGITQQDIEDAKQLFIQSGGQNQPQKYWSDDITKLATNLAAGRASNVKAGQTDVTNQLNQDKLGIAQAGEDRANLASDVKFGNQADDVTRLAAINPGLPDSVAEMFQPGAGGEAISKSLDALSKQSGLADWINQDTGQLDLGRLQRAASYYTKHKQDVAAQTEHDTLTRGQQSRWQGLNADQRGKEAYMRFTGNASHNAGVSVTPDGYTYVGPYAEHLAQRHTAELNKPKVATPMRTAPGKATSVDKNRDNWTYGNQTSQQPGGEYLAGGVVGGGQGVVKQLSNFGNYERSHGYGGPALWHQLSRLWG